MWGGSCKKRLPVCDRDSVLKCYAIEVVALEILAGGFSLVLIQAGERGAIVSSAPFIDRFGERIGAGKDLRRLGLRCREPLLRLLFPMVGAHLDEPAAAHLRVWGCSGGGVGSGAPCVL